MPRSGSGQYTPPAGQPVVTNTVISSTVFNALVDDVGNELTNSIARDGQSPATANIPFGGFKATGLGAATIAGDAVRYEQVGTLNAAEVHAASTKATPVDADELPILDSAATFGLKNLTWANLKATLLATVNSWGAAQTFSSQTTTGTATFNGDVALGNAATDTTTLVSQLSASGSVGTSGQVLTSAGTNATPAWATPATVTIASTAEAIAGTNNTNVITPLRMREGFNASGTAPVYACRAWVNFDGTLSGTITPRASGNIASVVKNGTGDYTITFTTAMPDANYCVNATGSNSSGGGAAAASAVNTSTAPTASAVRIINAIGSGGNADMTYVNVSIFR